MLLSMVQSPLGYATPGKPASAPTVWYLRTFFAKLTIGKVLPYKNDFGPMLVDVFRTPFPNPLHCISEEASLNAIRTLLKTDIALDGVQGESGFYIASPDYLKALRTLCDEHCTPTKCSPALPSTASCWRRNIAVSKQTF